MQRRRPASLAAVCCLFLLGACSGPQTMALLKAPGALPVRAEVEGVPFFPQKKYHCGPAALAMALAWTGLPVTADDLVSQVYTPGKEGALANDIVAAAWRNGRLAVRLDKVDAVLGEIAAGHPVLVFQNLSLDFFPQWHFALSVGYDLERRTIHLRSGRERRRITTLDTFEHTWARTGHWAIVVLPAGKLPATASEDRVLRAAAGLERVGQKQAAALAYRQILERWPHSLPALMGAGNARYATGDLKDAERAFRTATERHPGAAEAWNNLAHVLGQNGRRNEGIAAARHAVRLAGNRAGPFAETLRELQALSN